jgi:DNA polymerase theta
MNDLGLPVKVVDAYKKKGVKSLFPWQLEALECCKSGGNFVYSAPTSGGKSLVAEILLVRSLVKVANDRKAQGQLERTNSKPLALFILPFLSIVREKAIHMADILAAAGFTVRDYADAEESTKQPLSLGAENVAFCSIEKANITINKLSAQGRLNDLVCVVVDELHMVGDPDRGITLELLLTKLVHFQSRSQNNSESLQIVGMSATMGGMDVLRTWLHARLFVTDFRPVTLKEFVVVNGEMVYAKTLNRPWKSDNEDCENIEGNSNSASRAILPLRFQRFLSPLVKSEAPKELNSDGLIPLVAEGLVNKDSIIIFCPSRRNCETTVAMVVQRLFHQAIDLSTIQTKKDREAVIAEIEAATGVQVTEGLRLSLLAGIAYHHAGLLSEERRIVEHGYRRGVIHTLAATTTLAAGVNLPATRVIIKQSVYSSARTEARFNFRPLERMQYLQMAGRAGRVGLATEGEVYLLVSSSDAPLRPGTNSQLELCCCASVTRLLTAPPPAIRSRMLFQDAPCTAPEFRSSQVQRLFLEAILSGMVCTTSEALGLLDCSLAARQQVQVEVSMQRCINVSKSTVLVNAANEALRSLSHDLQILQETGNRWRPSNRGQAIYNSALPLFSGIELEKELDRVASTGVGLSFQGPWHLIFIVLSIVQQFGYSICDWPRWHSMLVALSPEKQRVAALMGVTLESARDLRLGKRVNNSKEATPDSHTRCAVALMIEHAVVGLEGLDGAVECWGKPGFLSQQGTTKGQLQRLMEEVSKLMSMAGLMCDSKGWWPLASLFREWARSVGVGVRQELFPLMQIDGMTAARARALFKAGYGSIELLAHADPALIASALRGGGNFASHIARGGSGKTLTMTLKHTRPTVATDTIAQRAAQVIITEAKRLIEQNSN